jgi:hypothetical protein
VETTPGFGHFQRKTLDSFGGIGLAARVDRAHANSLYLEKRIKEIGVAGGFLLVADVIYNNVCWWFIPKNLRCQVLADGPKAVYDQLDKVTPAIYEQMQKAGSMLVNFNPLSDMGLPRFFRIVLNQPCVTTEDMDFVLAEMQRLGDLI